MQSRLQPIVSHLTYRNKSISVKSGTILVKHDPESGAEMKIKNRNRTEQIAEFRFKAEENHA